MKKRFENSTELKSNTRKQNHHFKSAPKGKQFKGKELRKSTKRLDGIITYLRKQTIN